MARAVSVKIPTAKVIEMIEQKIAEISAEIASYPARKAQYQIDRKAYAEAVVARLSELLASRANELLNTEDYENGIRVSTNYRNAVEITIGKELTEDLVRPVEPTDPEPKGYYGGRGSGYNTKREELEKTLRLLRMTEQETITSSTYNSVLELL
jgi:outer membrane murein-binding lipoprotein Lpp